MGVSRQELEAEIEEKSLDLQAFLEARDIVRRRVLQVSESTSRLTPLPEWSGTDAVLGSMDLAIHAMERTVAELNEMLQALPEEEKATLRLVKGAEDEHEG